MHQLVFTSLLRTSVRTVRLPCDQPVDIDGFRLTDSVCSGLCLEIVLRVPVTVQGGEERGRDGGRERWKRSEGRCVEIEIGEEH
jgi:hypothetical protein